MRYAALIYVAEPDPGSITPEAWAEMVDAYDRFGKDGNDAGVIVGGAPLQPTTTATTVRVREGHRLTTDGPFAETREALAGFFLFECADLDEAIAWAARIPGASIGSVEVRPILDLMAGPVG
ncbi:MAG: YciI family protein [Chloroflexota bacterium]